MEVKNREERFLLCARPRRTCEKQKKKESPVRNDGRGGRKEKKSLILNGRTETDTKPNKNTIMGKYAQGSKKQRYSIRGKEEKKKKGKGGEESYLPFRNILKRKGSPGIFPIPVEGTGVSWRGGGGEGGSGLLFFCRKKRGIKEDLGHPSGRKIVFFPIPSDGWHA